LSGNDDDNQEMSLKMIENQIQDDDLEVIFEGFGIQDGIDSLTNFKIGENVCGNLTRNMMEQHIIHGPVSTEESVLIPKNLNIGEQTSTFEESDRHQTINNDNNDVVKVVLNLDQSMENHEPQCDELERNEVMDFNKFLLAMKSCISHYKLDLKQATAFNVICSSFMLAHLEEPLLKKGGLGRLVMNLTGSGGSGKALFLMQLNLFANSFVRLLESHSMILFL
jgi:hypothetical protein